MRNAEYLKKVQKVFMVPFYSSLIDLDECSAWLVMLEFTGFLYLRRTGLHLLIIKMVFELTERRTRSLPRKYLDRTQRFERHRVASLEVGCS